MARPTQQQQPAADGGAPPPAGETGPQAVEHRCGHVEVVPVWADGVAADAQKRRLRERADCGRCSGGRR